MPLMQNNHSITGYYQGGEMQTQRMQELIDRLLKEVGSGALMVNIDSRFPLSEAAEAHAYIERRKAVGRVLLIP